MHGTEFTQFADQMAQRKKCDSWNNTKINYFLFNYDFYHA